MRSTRSASVSAADTTRATEVLELRRLRGRLARGLDRGDRVGLRLLDRLDRDPAKPLESDLDGVTGQIDPLVHARRDPHSTDELSGLHRFVVVAAGDDQSDDEPGFLVRTQQREVLRRAHLHGDGAERIDDRRAQSHQRKCGRQLGLEDLFFALVACHARTSRQVGEGRVR
jgi:hypothetical protein